MSFDNPSPSAKTSDNTARPSEPVWSYRGYNLRSSEFTTAMVHYYRAEIQRSNVWRGRLDTTTNWAVVATGATLSFVLSSPDNHYGVIILNTLFVTLFLWIEARRYRYYELWSYRARLMETDFFAAMLVPPFSPHPEWAESLAESLLQPQFPISMWEAFGRRFRRNYMWIYVILGIAWAFKIYLHPTPATSWAEFIAHASVGPLSGEVMLAVGLIYNGLLFLIGLGTAGLHQATGEVLPKYEVSIPILGRWPSTAKSASASTPDKEAPRQASPVPARRRQQVLVLIITAKPDQVAQRIIKEMRRGVTALHGQGMYTHQERDVLMAAMTLTEVSQLKALVNSDDPNAFVIVAPAQEILGRGFQSLVNE
jgi:uncharacterized membrane protein